MPCGSGSPACSAMVQQFFRGRSASSPSTNFPGPAAGLDPGEPPGHPIEQPVGLGRPSGGLYAVAHGHRLIILMSTQPTMITRWPSYVRDRHAGRSRSTAGVLAPAASQRDLRAGCHEVRIGSQLVRKSSSNSTCPDNIPVRIDRATASNSETCGLVSE